MAKVKNSDLLDKKVVKREVEATLDLHGDMTISDELGVYLKEILSLDDNKIRNIMGVLMIILQKLKWDNCFFLWRRQ